MKPSSKEEPYKTIPEVHWVKQIGGLLVAVAALVWAYGFDLYPLVDWLAYFQRVAPIPTIAAEIVLFAALMYWYWKFYRDNGDQSAAGRLIIFGFIAVAFAVGCALAVAGNVFSWIVVALIAAALSLWFYARFFFKGPKDLDASSNSSSGKNE